MEPGRRTCYVHTRMQTCRQRIGVIFDVDGVLVDSGAAHYQSWRILAEQEGIRLTEDEFRKTFGMTSRDIIRTLWGRDLTEEQICLLDARKEAIYRGLITGKVPVAPGAMQALTRLRAAGYVLAVASSGPPENIELVLTESGLRPCFAAIVSGLEVRRGKPAPDIFLLAAQRAGLAPSTCVVVEDAPAGIAAGRAAGMAVIACCTTHAPETLRRSGADCVVSSLQQITPELVAQLVRRSRGPAATPP